MNSTPGQLVDPLAHAKPRILYLTKVYPYPPSIAGDAVYSRGVIESLSANSKLTVLCCDHGGTRVNNHDIDWHVSGEPRSGQIGSVFSFLPLISWRFATPTFRRNLQQLLKREWDAILLDNIGLAHALPLVQAYRDRHPNTRVVYISHELEYSTRSAKYDSYKLSPHKRLATKWDLRKVRTSERSLITESDIVTAINDADLEPLKRICPDRKYYVLTPGYNGPVLSSRTITPATPRRVLMLGGRRSEQKRTILMEWLEASYQAFSSLEIEMVVAGDMDTSFQRSIRSKYPKVQVLGYVNNLRELASSARLGIIADTVGGGFKLRLLSHVFERIPMIGLREAMPGLPTEPGHGYLCADTLSALVTLACRTIDDLDRLNSLHNTAFRDCVSSFAWQSRGTGLASAIRDHTNELLV